MRPPARSLRLSWGDLCVPACILACILMAVQCSATQARTIEVEPGARVLVMARVDRRGAPPLELTLANAGAVRTPSAQRAAEQDRSLKVIPDALMQALLDEFTALGFFEMASAQPDAGAKSWVLVRRDDTTYVASGRQPTGEAIGRWSKCLEAFTTTYNAVDSFTPGTVSPDQLERSGEATNSGSASTRDKARHRPQHP